jgi:hypothetical protein
MKVVALLSAHVTHQVNSLVLKCAVSACPRSWCGWWWWWCCCCWCWCWCCRRRRRCQRRHVLLGVLREGGQDLARQRGLWRVLSHKADGLQLGHLLVILGKFLRDRARSLARRATSIFGAMSIFLLASDFFHRNTVLVVLVVLVVLIISISLLLLLPRLRRRQEKHLLFIIIIIVFIFSRRRIVTRSPAQQVGHITIMNASHFSPFTRRRIFFSRRRAHQVGHIIIIIIIIIASQFSPASSLAALRSAHQADQMQRLVLKCADPARPPTTHHRRRYRCRRRRCRRSRRTPPQRRGHCPRDLLFLGQLLPRWRRTH